MKQKIIVFVIIVLIQSYIPSFSDIHVDISYHTQERGYVCVDSMAPHTQRASNYDWVKIPFSGPSPRYGAMMARMGNGRVLLFGGMVDRGGYENDTWVFDTNNGWIQISPSESPPPRAFGAMAYAGSNRIVLFGGYNNVDGALDDTWIFNIATNTWQRHTLSAFRPPKRYSHSMAYLSTNKIIIFGGIDVNGQKLNDTWIFNIQSGQWIEKSPTHSPSPRSSCGLAHASDSIVYLFGGHDGIYSLNDLWVYDGVNNNWVSISPMSGDPWPSERFAMVFTYLTTDTLLLFGGGNDSSDCSDTWTYNISQGIWTPYSGTHPDGRKHSAASSVEGRDSVILFGGYNTSQINPYLSDTWAFIATPVNTPILEYTTENGFQYDGVDPDFGEPFDSFMFRVKYSHPDNVGPSQGYPVVHLLKDGIEIPGSPFTLDDTDPNNSDYTGGKIYAKVITIQEKGYYSYYFEAYDENGIAATGPLTSEHDGPVVNTPPVLKNGIVSPEAGNDTTIFRYSVEYYDNDNDPPDEIRVVIDSQDFVMAKEDSSDSTYIDGVVYIYETQLAPGNHTYWFYARDWHNETYLPEDGENTGPYVSTVPEMFDAGINPGEGSNETLYSFFVTYIDPDNTPPVYIMVYIDGVPYNMSQVDLNDTNYSDGCTYRYITMLAPGDHIYYFEASDGTNTIRFPKTGNLSGPYVNAIPYLFNGSVSPLNGAVGEIYTYTVTYLDAGNEAPREVVVNIDGIDHTMSLVGNATYSKGALYRFKFKITEPIIHTFSFSATDGIYDARGDIGMHQGPYVTTPPYVSLIAPVNGAVLDTLPVLQWDGGDADGDIVTYSVYLASNKSLIEAMSPTALIAETKGEVLDLTSIYDAMEDGIYYWTVSAFDGNLNSNADNGIWYFIINSSEDEANQNNPPTCSLISPENNTVFEVGAKILLQWTGEDKDGDSIQYNLYVSRDLTSIYKSSSKIYTGSNTSYEMVLEETGRYYWTVKAYDSKTEVGCISGIWQFDVVKKGEIDISVIFKDKLGRPIENITVNLGDTLTLYLYITNNGIGVNIRLKIITPYDTDPWLLNMELRKDTTKVINIDFKFDVNQDDIVRAEVYVSNVSMASTSFSVTVIPVDTDGDSIPDYYDDDDDNDGLKDSMEIEIGTDPLMVDTDGDGISDYDEVANGTNPLIPDETETKSNRIEDDIAAGLMPIVVLVLVLTIVSILIYVFAGNRTKKVEDTSGVKTKTMSTDEIEVVEAEVVHEDQNIHLPVCNIHRGEVVDVEVIDIEQHEHEK